MMAVAAIVFAGCAEKLPEPEGPNQEQPTPEPEPVVGEITLKGEESLVFSCDGGSQNVAFEATLEWTATASEEFVTVGPLNGDAGDNLKITVSVPEYEGYDDRTATITLTCGDDTKTIQVTQKKKGALVLAPSTIQVPAEGQSLSIVVQANSNVTAAIADDAKAWISELKGLVDYGFTFVIAPNEAVESRTGHIVFTNETGETEIITLEQAGTPIVGKITLQGEDAFTVSDEGGELTVAFNATLAWTASSSEEFVTVEPKTGEAGDVSVTLTVAENDSYDPRTATVTLTCDEDVKTIEITQKQKGALLFTESTIAVSAEGGNVEVVAKANSNVTYAIADDAKAWISELKGLVEYKFNFIVTANESDQARTGQIVFTNETGQTETVTIQQAGTEALTFAANFAVEGVAPFKTLWANGDVVAVNGVASDALVLDAAAATADFVVRDKLEAPFNALYPASVLKAEAADVVTLPAQAYVTEVAPEAVLPMTAQAQDKTLAFNQLMSVVKFTVTGDEAYKLDYAVLSASQKLYGDFTVDYSSAKLTAVGTTDDEKAIRCELDNELTAEGVNLYFVVPAAEYTSFALKLVDVAGLPMTYTKEAFTAEAGTVAEVPAFEFKPDQINIATAADLVKFATQYNAKKLDTNVKVTLTDDITFDAETCAAFAATGGIGVKISNEETYYFNGAFDGNDKEIKSYVSSIPLFAYTGDGGEISNVIFDNTCQLVVNADATDTYHGILVGRHKGKIDNCTSAASVVVNNLEDAATSTQYYGVLVGRNYGGVVENSVVTGNITCAQSGVTLSKNVCVGGIAGGQAEAGEIKACEFKGNITFSDGTDFGGISAAKVYFYVGGIVGYVENGKVVNCTSGADGVSTKIDVRGNLVPAVGGVAGWIVTSKSTEVAGCKNYMALSYASNGARADTTPCRIGGIASHSAAPISMSENYGAISSVGNSTSIYLGGIAGDGAGASNCTNHSTGKITRTSQLTDAQGNRYIYLGGIMGGITAAGDFENCTNNAAVLNGNTGTSTNTTVDLGGIVGAAYDGGNAHQLDFKNCVNTGTITAQATQTSAIVLARTTVAGIIGYGPAASTTITYCDNSGYIYCQYNGKNSEGRCAYSGGIAGLLGGNATGAANLEILNCDNTGIVYNRNYNSIAANTLATGSYGGGIVGAINGTADGKAKLQNCTSSVGNLNCYRGINGGIAGYAGNATLSNNTASQAINPNANVEGNGGVVGQLVGSDMSGCAFSGSSFDPTANTLAKNFGGLAYIMDGTSSITDCKVDGATINKGTVSAAVLVSNAAAGATITNCGVKGTLDGAAITLESTMIATDGGATVSGTYLLD